MKPKSVVVCKKNARFPTDRAPYCACLLPLCEEERGNLPPTYTQESKQ